MVLNEIGDICDDRIRIYAGLTESQLRHSLKPEDGIIIAESPKVIKIALQQGWEPISILCERKHIEGDAAEIISMAGEDIDVFTADRQVLAQLTGYTLTRGVLCAMRRKPDLMAEEILKRAGRICVLDGVCDTTNIGSIFRSAAALGIDGILLTPTACDPMNRRAIRVSMGTVFLIPWARLNDISLLKYFGFKTLAMALRKESISIDDGRLKSEPRLAIIMGTEGSGLSEEVIDFADYVAKIPMAYNVDSLNVAAASAIAFWELRGS